MLEAISFRSCNCIFLFLVFISLVRLNGKNKKIRDLYEIYIELGHDVFEERIKKPMKLCLQNSCSNIFSMNCLNTIIFNAMEKSKLGEAGCDIFSPPSFEEKLFICYVINVESVH